MTTIITAKKVCGKNAITLGEIVTTREYSYGRYARKTAKRLRKALFLKYPNMDFFIVKNVKSDEF